MIAAALALAGTAMGGCADRDMTAQDAREFTRRALEEAGLEDVRVDPRPEAGVFRPTAGDPIAVWKTRARAEGGVVHLYVTIEGERAVFLNDVADDGGALLTDDQFAQLEEFRLDPAEERHREEIRGPALLATGLALAAVAVIAFALVTARVPRRPWARRRRGLGSW